MNITSEYRERRCCMCPNIEENKPICPGIKGTPHPDDSNCCFVKEYVDQRGWRYRVMTGIGENAFKGRYNKPGKSGWKGITVLPWRSTFDEAQADLNKLAKAKNWLEIDGGVG